MEVKGRKKSFTIKNGTAKLKELKKNEQLTIVTTK